MSGKQSDKSSKINSIHITQQNNVFSLVKSRFQIKASVKMGRIFLSQTRMPQNLLLMLYENHSMTATFRAVHKESLFMEVTSFSLKKDDWKRAVPSLISGFINSPSVVPSGSRSNKINNNKNVVFYRGPTLR